MKTQDLVSRGFLRFSAAGICAILVMVSLSRMGNAQALVDAAENEQQLSVASNVVDICPRLAALGGFNLTGDIGDLFQRCNGAIVVANRGDSTLAANVLQQIAAEEIIAQEAAVRGTTAPQLSAVAARVSAILGQRGRVSLGANPDYERSAFQIASSDSMPVTQLSSADEQSVVDRLGGFMTGRYGLGEHDETTLEAGYEYDDVGAVVGLDYLLTDEFAIGGTFGYNHWNADFDRAAGDLATDSYVLGAYSVWFPTPELSLSGYAAYGWVSYESDRLLSYSDSNGTVNRVANGETDGNTIELTINGNYELSYNSLRIGPAVRLSYFRTEVDGFDESGAQGLNLSFQDQDGTSFQSALGVGATYAVSTSLGVLTLQGYSEWIHEYDDDSRTITVRYTNDPFGDSPAIILTTDAPDRDRFGLGAGAALLLPGGATTFISFDTIVGHSDYSSYALSVGLRLAL